MKSIFVHPLPAVNRSFEVAGDKSISHRAVILAAIASGKSTLSNLSQGEDVQSTIAAMKQLGVRIKQTKKNIIVTGVGLHGLKPSKQVINVGNSGTTIRLLAGLLAAQPFESKLTGDSSIRRRPMSRVINPLYELGFYIFGFKNNSLAPIKAGGDDGGTPSFVTSWTRKKLGEIVGRPRPTFYGRHLSVRLDLPMASAQVKSAVLLAGLYQDTKVTVSEPSRSRDHTEKLLSHMGASITVKGLQVSIVGDKSLRPLNVKIPGDFSSATFLLSLGLLLPNSTVTVRNVLLNPTRVGWIKIVQKMDGTIRITHRRKNEWGEWMGDVTAKSSVLKSYRIDGSLLLDAIDEFPILCVLASRAKGLTRIRGGEELRVKETDRIHSMIQILKQLGVKHTEFSDGLDVHGGAWADKKPVFNSYGDHRVALAAYVIALTSTRGATIQNTDCIKTSFPEFLDYFPS